MKLWERGLTTTSSSNHIISDYEEKNERTIIFNHYLDEVPYEVNILAIEEERYESVWETIQELCFLFNTDHNFKTKHVFSSVFLSMYCKSGKLKSSIRIIPNFLETYGLRTNILEGFQYLKKSKTAITAEEVIKKVDEIILQLDKARRANRLPDNKVYDRVSDLRVTNEIERNNLHKSSKFFLALQLIVDIYQRCYVYSERPEWYQNVKLLIDNMFAPKFRGNCQLHWPEDLFGDLDKQNNEKLNKLIEEGINPKMVFFGMDNVENSMMEAADSIFKYSEIVKRHPRVANKTISEKDEEFLLTKLFGQVSLGSISKSATVFLKGDLFDDLANSYEDFSELLNELCREYKINIMYLSKKSKWIKPNMQEKVQLLTNWGIEISAQRQFSTGARNVINRFKNNFPVQYQEFEDNKDIFLLVPSYKEYAIYSKLIDLFWNKTQDRKIHLFTYDGIGADTEKKAKQLIERYKNRDDVIFMVDRKSFARKLEILLKGAHMKTIKTTIVPWIDQLGFKKKSGELINWKDFDFNYVRAFKDLTVIKETDGYAADVVNYCNQIVKLIEKE